MFVAWRRDTASNLEIQQEEEEKQNKERASATQKDKSKTDVKLENDDIVESSTDQNVCEDAELVRQRVVEQVPEDEEPDSKCKDFAVSKFNVYSKGGNGMLGSKGSKVKLVSSLNQKYTYYRNHGYLQLQMQYTRSHKSENEPHKS
eukprot:SAG25_NODE_4140_length_881_cov_1.493606_1_plen_145_part_10